LQRTIQISTPAHNGLYDITQQVETIVSESGIQTHGQHDNAILAPHLVFKEIFYSDLSDSTGFFLAACQPFQLVVNKATSKVINPAEKNIHQSIVVL
jgi:hypothetical protein